jgi:hypothetical protein
MRKEDIVADLTTKKRNALPKSEFALPAQRMYPIDTRARAGNAKARAQQQFEKGKMSQSTRDKIFAAANHVLQHSRVD